MRDDEEPVTWRERAEVTLMASMEMTIQVGTAMGAAGLGMAYLGVKLLATPINLAEAFLRPRHWTPPWRLL